MPNRLQNAKVAPLIHPQEREHIMDATLVSEGSTRFDAAMAAKFALFRLSADKHPISMAEYMHEMIGLRFFPGEAKQALRALFDSGYALESGVGDINLVPRHQLVTV